MVGVSSASRIAIIGEGKMAYDCLRRAVKLGGVAVPVLVTRIADDPASRRLAAFCGTHSVEVVDTHDPNSTHALHSIQMADPHAIFNINGFSILKDELISLPRLGVVNFHNGPLPRYAGLNIPTWVIWNGESRHGVTWHFVDQGIDTGDVIAQAMFDIDERETAATLTMKCIVHGIDIFDGVLNSVLSGQCPRRKQMAERTYYRGKDIPNDRFIDLAWPAWRIDRLVRSLNFHPFPSLLGYPRLRLDDSFINLRVAEVREQPGSDSTDPPGTIVEIDERAIHISVRNGHLVASAFVSADGKPLDVAEAVEKYGLSRGMLLS